MPVAIQKMLPMSPVHLSPMFPVCTSLFKGGIFRALLFPLFGKETFYEVCQVHPRFFSGRLAHVLPGDVS